MISRARIITVLVSLPVVAVFVQFGQWPWFAMVTGLTLAAVWEFNRMMEIKGHQPHLWLGCAFALIALMSMQFPAKHGFVPALTIGLMISLVWQLFDAESAASVVDWALTIAGSTYIGLGMAHLLGLRWLPAGTAWVWLALLSTWGCDSFAYLIGKPFGKHKFWPRLSPNKTWEGIAGGVLGALLGAYLVTLFSAIPLAHALIVGVLVSIAGPLGDVSISMMKRYAGVKDSSNLIPGHGGVLDRLDSVLFVVIVVFYYATWIVV